MPSIRLLRSESTAVACGLMATRSSIVCRRRSLEIMLRSNLGNMTSPGENNINMSSCWLPLCSLGSWDPLDRAPCFIWTPGLVIHTLIQDSISAVLVLYLKHPLIWPYFTTHDNLSSSHRYFFCPPPPISFLPQARIRIPEQCRFSLDWKGILPRRILLFTPSHTPC